MENQIFNDIGTVLDLNGPTLSFTTEPTGVTGIGTAIGETSGGASVELVGIATVTFVGSADSIGTISYQWYYESGSKVENDTYITGAATTTLTLSNLITPTDSQKKYYLQADYVPTYVGLGTGYQTGNALNDPLISGIGTVGVTPLIEIIAQPTSAQAKIDTNKTFTVNADLTDSFYADDLTYQWTLDGEDITDGVNTHIVKSWLPSGFTYWTDGMSEDWDDSGSTTSGSNDYINVALPQSGKYYWETRINNASTHRVLGISAGGTDYDGGIVEAAAGAGTLYTDDIFGYYYNNPFPLFLTRNASGTARGSGDSGGIGIATHGDPNPFEWVNGEKLMWALDADADKIWFGYNGTWLGSGDPSNGLNPTILGEDLSASSFYFKIGYNTGEGTLTLTNVTKDSAIATNEEYSYTSPGSHTTPALATDIEVTIAAGKGGGGGTDGGGPSGAGGNGRAGRFSLSDGAKTLEFKIGGIGNGGGTGSGNPSMPGNGGLVSGSGDGGSGGDAGPSGWSGAGGGGGAASYILNDSTIIIVASGGGGGGGGSLNRGGNSGSSGGEFGSTAGSISVNNGSRGCDVGGDGGGGGGAGGGVNTVDGGGCGSDNGSGGGGGGQGSSSYKSPESTLLNQWTNDGAGYANLKYTGYTDKPITVTTKTTVSGTDTNTLTIKTDHTSVKTLQCRISSDTASNSSILTDKVSFAVVDDTDHANIVIESIGITDTANISTIDLQNGEYTFETGVNAGSSVSSEYYSFYSSDRDIDVEMDLYGGKGEDWASGSVGGEGGYSRIRFTMEKGIEYVIAGLTNDIQAPFLYKKGVLMAVVGEGGGGGPYGDGREGGAGGGVGIAGEDGTNAGGGGGFGGVLIPSGTLNTDGIFGSLYSHPIILNQGVNAMQQILHAGDSYAEGREGGRAPKCSKGEYWAQQGKGACDDLGNVKFRLGDGTEVTNTDNITRGFKAGYPIIATAGKGMGRGTNTHQQSKGGHGGNGVTGGQGGQLAGGGGGSGYQDGSVTVLDTMQGGSTGDAKVVLRLADTITTTPLDGLVKDEQGRILILSSTDADSPNNLTKRSVVEVGSKSCVNDEIWRYILDLARDGTNDYRLAVCAPNGNYGTRVKLAGANPRNIWRMMNANQLTLRDSLTGWVAPNSIYPEDIGYANRLVLAWDETTGRTISGSDYSLLWWVSGSGWGYYGMSSNSFFTPTVYHLASAEWWLLPPGVPDF